MDVTSRVTMEFIDYLRLQRTEPNNSCIVVLYVPWYWNNFLGGGDICETLNLVKQQNYDRKSWRFFVSRKTLCQHYRKLRVHCGYSASFITIIYTSMIWSQGYHIGNTQFRSLYSLSFITMIYTCRIWS